MKLLKLSLCATVASFAMAAEAAHADALGTPAMGPTLSADANPTKFDAGPFGKLYITGAVSGLVNAQNHADTSLGDHSSFGDASNAQVFIQKTDGPIQFYIQAGAYSFPTLAAPYAGPLGMNARNIDNATFGFLPQAFIKIVPNSDFNVIAGKLPTLIGAEYGFTFENVNVNRGLLWAQEPLVSRGVQANYSHGPLSVSVSLNDGYYSDVFNWVSGLASYNVTSKDTLAVAAGGNFGTTPQRSRILATPTPQNNGSIYNVMYTHTEGPWVFNPYFQYDHVPAKPALGWAHSSNTWGAAVLLKYSFNSEFSLGARGEYEKQTGTKGDMLAPVLLYGPGSDAWSLTATPTWQKGIYFVRGDLSYVRASVPIFGPTFGQKDQFRFTGEAGVLF